MNFTLKPQMRVVAWISKSFRQNNKGSLPHGSGPFVPCYAVRHMIGLRTSSNRVEKANDLIVAKRQKHNGMSWSFKGSGALASIKCAHLNGELSCWIRNRTINEELAA
ncbi:hypothetical protein PRLR6025_01540 [Prevotella lacticifex]|nr:hypothetical protein PRLR6025_01540 [Prevotella lacticifex]